MRICIKNYTGQRGIYAKLIPDYKTLDKLEKTLRQSDPPFALGWFAHRLHTTVICSDSSPQSVYIQFPRQNIVTRIVRAEYWSGHNGGGFVVFRIRSKQVLGMHRAYSALGAIHKYGHFDAHMTAGIEVGKFTPALDQWVSRVTPRLTVPVVFSRLVIRDILF